MSGITVEGLFMWFGYGVHGVPCVSDKAARKSHSKETSSRAEVQRK